MAHHLWPGEVARCVEATDQPAPARAPRPGEAAGETVLVPCQGLYIVTTEQYDDCAVLYYTAYCTALHTIS